MKRALCIAVVVGFAALAFAQPKDDSNKKTSDYHSTSPVLTGKAKAKFAATSIQVLEFRPADVKVPAQFEMATYENTVRELEKLKQFKHVYRDGDKRADADPNCVKLKATIWQFKEGSTRQRQVTTVKGASSIHVSVHVEDAKGKALLDKDVSGAVHFIGENLGVTQNLANNIAELINANFD